MHCTRYSVLLGILLTGSVAWSLEGAPTSTNVQGKLTATGGGPVTAGNYTFAFKLFDAPAAGTQVWPPAGSENHILALGTDGLWTALLGKDFALLSDMVDDTGRYLEITITPPVGSAETFGRIRMSSTLFTLEAAQLNGRTGDDYVEIAGDVMAGRLQIDYGSNGTDIDLRQDGGSIAIVELSSGGSTRCQLVGDTKGHLVLADASGDITASLDATPSGGGVLDLNQEDGTDGVLLRGGSTTAGDGSKLEMRNSSGLVTVDVYADNVDGSGLLSVCNNAGASKVSLLGNDYGHVFLRDTDGSLAVNLDATSSLGGHLTLNQEDGTAGAELRGGTTVDGATLDLRNSGGSVAVNVDAQSGSVNLNKENGAAGAELSGGSTALGAIITLKDANGDETAKLDAQSQNGGFLRLSQEDGTNGVYLRGGSTSDGATLYLWDAAGAATIFLDADLTSGGGVGIGTLVPDTRLHVVGGTDASLLNGSGYMVLGNVGSANLVIDNNELQARSNEAFTSLFLQAGGGNVGIGTNVTEATLDVNDSGGTVAVFNRNTNDGTIISLQQADAEVGTITVAGAIVSYNAFTGSHYGWTDQHIDRGMLVVMTGSNRYVHDVAGSEVIYSISPSSRANDPRCLGAYLALSEPAQPHGPENPHLVMAVGNGEMWVADLGEDVEVGDYLVSSDVPGHAMKDHGRFPVSYIVARAAEAVDWAQTVETTGGTRHRKISVLFESFVRDRTCTSEGLTARVAELEDALERQSAQLEHLRQMVNAMDSEGEFAAKP